MSQEHASPGHRRGRPVRASWRLPAVAICIFGCQVNGGGIAAMDGGADDTNGLATGGSTGSGGNGTGNSGSGGSLTGTGGSARGSGGAASGGGGTAGGPAAASGGRTGSGGATGTGGSVLPGTGGAGPGLSTQGITCMPQVWDAQASGWASTSGGTTGGGNAPPSAGNTVTNINQLNLLARGTGAMVIYVSGRLSGRGTIGSNKTIWGLCGAEIDGGLDLAGSQNVIIRNLKIVGLNCTDSPADCSSGDDAVQVVDGARHLWFDHDDISDGSDGTLDITHGSDLITVSWTKFHYSGRRAGDHQFCSLVGHDDANGAEDTGHLNVTYNHVWWADNIDQRMPRVRFGKVHVFNNLYTAVGDSFCIELGVNCNIRSENNVFLGVRTPVFTNNGNAASIIQSIGNQGSATNIGGAAFTPPYPYSLDATTAVAAAVMAGAGVK